MSKGEYLIAPKGTKFTGSGKLGLRQFLMYYLYCERWCERFGSFIKLQYIVTDAKN